LTLVSEIEGVINVNDLKWRFSMKLHDDISNRFSKRQAFCVGFAKASNYGLDLSQIPAPARKMNFLDHVKALLLTKIF
jgi:hypothetical protein